MKKLIISEKPSVAADISKALGTFKKFDDRYENDQYVISWAIGHLVELFMPEDIDPILKRWSLDSLPIIPGEFKTKPIEKTKKRFNELKKLMQRKDIELLINGCDAGREGELIFTYIYELVGCKKPFMRLWLSSMTLQGINEAFGALKTKDEMQALQDAARCRSEADWLVGINGTRAVTTKMYSAVARQVATVGRVQTPTLAMIVNRDFEIRNFVPESFWKISGTFGLCEGKYDGLLQKSEKLNDKNPHDRADRLWSGDEAENILKELQGKKFATVSDQKRRSKQSAPRLYDLTTLQREVNSRYNMPANMTLKIAQSLYERHKCITYPRTDSRALTEDYVETCYKILSSISDEHAVFAKRIIQNKLVDGKNRKIFNNKQVSDHFAIIPTPQPPKSLTEEERKIFTMILKRFLCVFFPDAEFDITTRTSIVENFNFKTEGKVLVSAGWMEIYGKEEIAQHSLPVITENDGTPPQANIINISIIKDETRPPAHYNEATLLAAMEGARKFLDDEELADAMRERGLGTPATRAQIIEHLIALKYIIRDKKDLISTAKAENLLSFLQAAGIEVLSSPIMTGEWEYKLRQMESGTFKREVFMNEISELTASMVEKTKKFVEDDIFQESQITSPTDNKPMLEGLRNYRSQDGTLTISKIMGGRKLSEDEIQNLIIQKKIGPLDDFQSKTGARFSATLILGDDNKVSFLFENSESGSEPTTKLSQTEINSLKIISKCPLDGADVVETENAYICKNYFEKKCKLRLSKKMLDLEIDPKQIKKLLSDKKTDMMEGFRSKRTGKLFSARLILQKDGKIRFEFK